MLLSERGFSPAVARLGHNPSPGDHSLVGRGRQIRLDASAAGLAVVLSVAPTRRDHAFAPAGWAGPASARPAFRRSWQVLARGWRCMASFAIQVAVAPAGRIFRMTRR